MSVKPGDGLYPRPQPGAEELVCRYTVLLELYKEMEKVTEAVFRAVQDAAAPKIVGDRIGERMTIAESIIQESRAISALKKALSEAGGLDGGDRELIKELEERMTRAVNRMVEQESRGHDLVMRKGVRIARR